MNTPSISLIIAVYNHADFLDKVLAGLTNQTFTNYEIVVADDGSGPEIKTVIEQHEDRFPHSIRHVRQDDHGFRKTMAVNRAVAASNGDYLVFIDGDCLLHGRFLERHYKRRKPRTVLSGRRIRLTPAITRKMSLEDIRSRKIEKPAYWWFECDGFDRFHGFYMPMLFGLKNIRRHNRYEILGCNFSVHKIDFYSINGYDERITGRGLEDNNLCSRFLAGNMIVESVKMECLQYHMYHSFDPIPHNQDMINEFREVDDPWTPFGIVKKEKQGCISP